MKPIDPKFLIDPSAHIPTGDYCYSREGTVCPFWAKDESKPHQESGYCHHLKTGDWMEEGMTLLWDKVKECGENME